MHYRILQLVTTFNIHGLAISIMEISLESNYYLQRISYYLLKFPLNSILRLSSFITFSNQPQVIYLSYSSVTLTQFTLHTATLRFAFNYTIKYQNPIELNNSISQPCKISKIVLHHPHWQLLVDTLNIINLYCISYFPIE